MIKRPLQIITFLIQRPEIVFQYFVSIFRCSGKVVQFYNLKYPLVCFRMINLMIRRGFVPHEALQLGLLDLNFDKKDLGKFTSKREMSQIQRTLNPASLESLTEDKSIFYMYCKALGLPVPRLYAVFFRHTAGYSADASILSSREDWASLLNNLPTDFIVKPARAKYGYCINCFSRTPHAEYIDAASGMQFSADDIYNLMFSNPYHDTFVIQERLINHPELARLSNTDFLQTMRVLTFVDRNGKCKILHAFLRPIVGKNIIDNHVHGTTGNLLAEIVIDTGILKSAVSLTPNVSGIKTVPSHPTTGISFDGFHIPLWDDVCRLVNDASLKLLPIRIIGWDIAVTPNGIYIIEANYFADPPSFHQKMDRILSKINNGS